MDSTAATDVATPDTQTDSIIDGSNKPTSANKDGTPPKETTTPSDSIQNKKDMIKNARTTTAAKAALPVDPPGSHKDDVTDNTMTTTKSATQTLTTDHVAAQLPSVGDGDSETQDASASEKTTEKGTSIERGVRYSGDSNLDAEQVHTIRRTEETPDPTTRPVDDENSNEDDKEGDIREELGKQTKTVQVKICPWMIPFFSHIRGSEEGGEKILHGYSHDVNNNPIQATRVCQMMNQCAGHPMTRDQNVPFLSEYGDDAVTLQSYRSSGSTVSENMINATPKICR